MTVIEIEKNSYLVKISDDEEYQLRVLIEAADNQFIRNIPELIGFQISYLAEMAFTTVQEPNQNGHTGS